MYDVIGDIHGHAAKLEALLSNLGYVHTDEVWVPPLGRQAIFLGDLIDRGPEQLKVINIVRRMVDAGYARCIMGNHEFNAIGYVTELPGSAGKFLRTRSPSKVAQHAEFLRQVGEGSALHRDLVEWFRTLPPMLDLGGIRVVHAWWHQPYADLVARDFGGSRMSDEFLYAAFDKESQAYAAMEGLTKGLEIRLPKGHWFVDPSGVQRKMVRTKWWSEGARCYRDVAIVPHGQEHMVPAHPLPDEFSTADTTGAPIFVGHYWFKGLPVVQSSKVACLDWSAAGDGPVVAYRWDGEAELSNAKFVTSGSAPS